MSGPRIRHILRIALIPLLLAGLGYGAQALGMAALDVLAGYQGAPVGALPAGRATAPVSGRVVVVVVDGLREDTSRQMPNFQRLRAQGADLPSWSGLPSLSLPGYTVLGTGAMPDLSGVASNWWEGPVVVDSLFARAREAGLPSALAAMGGWDTLYGPWATTTYTASWPSVSGDYLAAAPTTPAIGQEALRLLRESDAALVYVHFGETDEAGHARGGTSPEYMEAALHCDEQIGSIAAALDWSHDTLVLTADHGMSADIRGHGGGHGGGEDESRRVPVVMVGRGIRPGTYPEGSQADIVPTVAALLGLPIPAHSQGRTRLDVLVLTPDQRADKALALGEQQEALHVAYLRSLGANPAVDGLEQARAALRAGEHGRVEGLVRDYLARLDAAVERAKANLLWQERLVRLPYLLVPLLAAGLFVGLYRPRREIGRPALLAALFFLVHAVVYLAVRGNDFSFTTVAGQDVVDFFLARTVDAAIVTLVVAAAAGLAWRRRPWLEVVWGANLSAAIIGWGWVLQLGLFLWLYGLVPVWRLPDMGWGFKFYVDLLATVGVGFAGFLFPWLALSVSRVPALAEWGTGLFRRGVGQARNLVSKKRSAGQQGTRASGSEDAGTP